MCYVQLEAREIRDDAKDLLDQNEYDIGDMPHKMRKVCTCYYTQSPVAMTRLAFAQIPRHHDLECRRGRRRVPDLL